MINQDALEIGGGTESVESYESGLTSTSNFIAGIGNNLTVMGLWRTVGFIIATGLVIYLIREFSIRAPRFFWFEIAPRFEGRILEKTIWDKQDSIETRDNKAELEQRRKAAAKRDKAHAKRAKQLRPSGSAMLADFDTDFVRQPINFNER